MQDYRAAIAAKPHHAEAFNNLAWTLATCPQSEIRNGKEAVSAALQACELNSWKSPGTIGVLAAAYAENGQFESAVKYQQQALATIDGGSKAEFQERLKLYQGHKAYHEAMPSEPRIRP